MKAKLLKLQGWLLPSLCHSCGRAAAEPSARLFRFGLLCENCRSRLLPAPDPQGLPDGLPLLAAFQPEQPILALIKGWKYSGRDAAVDFLARAMAARLSDAGLKRPWWLVPIPMPLWRRISRGFNQSEVLARRIARLCGAPAPQLLLTRSSVAGRQAGRSRAERLRRAEREFRLRRLAPEGGTLILVDDLCTTGATLQACHRALRLPAKRTAAALVLTRVGTPGWPVSPLTVRISPEYLVNLPCRVSGNDPGPVDREGRGPMLAKLSVRDLDVEGKTVFVRVDYNVPLNDRQEVTDDTRIRASLDTVNLLAEKGAKLILASHLGRPKGKYQFELSLSPVADRLGELVEHPVRFARDCVGEEVGEMVEQLQAGQILFLENLRFHAEETANDPDFARALSSLAEVYVNDAFGTAHRAHASTEGMTHFFEQRAAGLLLEKEIVFLGRLLAEPERPASALLGGAKISGKIPVVANLLERMDTLMIGGGMAFTFFRALGLNVGKSIVDEKLLDTALETIHHAKESKREILLPVDVVVAKEITDDTETQVVLPTDIPEGWMGLDIGPKTIELYTQVIGASKSIFWNGPMGVFEVSKFAKGTQAMAKALAEATAEGASTVVGGGDSVAAINALALADQYTHISTGGGASLEFMEGKALPGIVALSDAKEAVV